MKSILRLAIVVFILNFTSYPLLGEESSPVSNRLTLSECYNLALKQSETIAINADLIKESEARFIQAIGALLPHVSFVATERRQDNSASASVGSERKFIFKQTLFAGFKEFAGMAGSKLQKEQRLNEKRRAEQLLFVDVSDAFYLLIEEKEDLKILEDIQTALNQRISDLKKREELGRSRRSEVVNAESQLYAVEAELELIKSQEAVARQLLEFLIGKPVEDIADTEANLPILNNEGYYMAKAVSRHDVVAAKQAWEVSKKEVAIAKAVFFPTVTAESNYYPYRSVASKDTKWDAQLKINVPIFEGIEPQGQVQETIIKAHEKELTYSQTKRLAIQDIRDSYAKLKYQIVRTNALKKALDSSEMNYSLQKDDYQLNLVNNLDVLEAIQTMQETKRNYIHSLYETKRMYWQLMVSGGEIK